MKQEILKFDFKQQLDNADTLELYIYSEVAPDGYNFWTGETVESETSADYFKEKLNEYKNVKNIIIYINSCGGSVREGYGIYAQLKRHTAFKTVYVDGFANSIASIIATVGDKVIMYLNSMMGIHNAMNVCYGNATELRKCADDLDKLMEGNRQIYLAKSNGKITLEKLKELLDAETMLTAAECFEYGFCDEVVDLQADTGKIAKMMKQMNGNMASQIKYFQTLKQSFIQALDAFEEKKIITPPPAEVVQQKTQDALELFLGAFLQSNAK